MTGTNIKMIKVLLTEGRYNNRYLDVASSRIASFIFRKLKDKYNTIPNKGFTLIKNRSLLNILGEDLLNKLEIEKVTVFIKQSKKIRDDTGIIISAQFITETKGIIIKISFSSDMFDFKDLTEHYPTIYVDLQSNIRHELEHAIQYSEKARPNNFTLGTIKPIDLGSLTDEDYQDRIIKDDIYWLNYLNDPQETEAWAVTTVNYFKKADKKDDFESVFLEVVWKPIEHIKKESNKKLFAKIVYNIFNYALQRYPEIAKKDDSIKDLKKFLISHTK